MKYTKLRKHLLSLRYFYFAPGLCGIVIAAVASSPAPTQAALKPAAPTYFCEPQRADGILVRGPEIPYTAAKDQDHEFLPVVDGTIFDHGPFDGIGEFVGEDLSNTVFMNSGIGEGRAAMEFDLSPVNPHQIKSAFLKIVPIGKGFLPGSLTIPVQLFGYGGDGSLQTDDFQAGCFITLLDGFTPNNVPISIDVSDFVRGIPPTKRVAGFSLRTNVHGAGIDYGSLELGPPPTLIVTLK